MSQPKRFVLGCSKPRSFTGDPEYQFHLRRALLAAELGMRSLDQLDAYLLKRSGAEAQKGLSTENPAVAPDVRPQVT